MVPPNTTQNMIFHLKKTKLILSSKRFLSEKVHTLHNAPLEAIQLLYMLLREI